MTEAVTGIDLVAEQIAIAAGRDCAWRSPRVRLRGLRHRMPHQRRRSGARFRCRARAPGARRTGRRARAIRVDTHIEAGTRVPPFYDSLLGKIIAHGATAAQALARLRGRGGDDAHRRASPPISPSMPSARGRGVHRGRRRYGVSRAPAEPARAHSGESWLTCALVETSLRDGNQCLWAALGIDTARTLSIAPAMDAVGFKAIDFTTSTHMGVAVRYKREDPWERIRLMAEATPEHAAAVHGHGLSLHLLGDGERRSSWRWPIACWRAHGIRRFCLADPMNDAAANVANARLVKQAGGEFVIAALVFTLSPIHDDAHYAACARTLAGEPGHRRAVHQGSGRTAVAEARRDADSRHQGRASATSRSSCTRTTPSGSRR